jgi:hypothetical protein
MAVIFPALTQTNRFFFFLFFSDDGRRRLLDHGIYDLFDDSRALLMCIHCEMVRAAEPSECG